MATNVITLESQPGIQRDGTQYDTKNYIDGQWVRFYRGRPIKIGGYKLIAQGNGTIIRTLYNYDSFLNPNTTDTYLGRENSVNYINFDNNGTNLTGEIDRTPANYIGNYYNQPGWGANSLWEFDVFTDRNSPGNPLIVAFVAPNANDISNTIEGPIYSGQTTGVTRNAPLTQVLDGGDPISAPVLVSGGVVFTAPILVAYGNSGLFRWSDPGNINSWPTGNSQTIANATKILHMEIARGSSQPQLLAWTGNAIISLTYTVGTDTNPDAVSWTAVTLDNNITVMSPRSIIGYANQFFWIGLNQFYFFNGVVQPLPNTVNSQFFFQNVNLSARAKIWGEIVSTGIGTEFWWHFPIGNSTECNHVIILQYENKIWFDTALSRAHGVGAGIFPLPMMTDNVPMNIATRGGFVPTYPLWMHEFGYDQINSPTSTSAIQSYFETHIYDFFEGNPNINKVMRTRRIEPNFVMNAGGNMTVTVNNRFFPSDTIANGQIKQSGPYTFNLNTTKIDAVNSQGRLVSFRFESNEVGGSYQMGKTLLDYNVGDERPSGAGNSGTGS